MEDVQLKKSDIRLRRLSSGLDRSNTPNRYASLHATLLIKDLQDAFAETESIPTNVRELIVKALDGVVIDKNKIFRERQKFRKQAKTAVQCHELLTCISFDGKKEQTLKTPNNIVIEEHITIIKEPNSKFIGYATPSASDAKSIQTAIVDFLRQNDYNFDNLVAISCDGTVTNTGYKGGVITLFESYLRRPLQWLTCLFHFNELPFQALMRLLLGKTKGPGLWPGEIGVGINRCMEYPVRMSLNFNNIQFVNFYCLCFVYAFPQPLPNFEPIAMGEMPANIDEWIIRDDQRYLYRMVLAINSGHCDGDLASQQPGRISSAHWLTTASRILRWYITQARPTKTLKNLTTFIVKVYAPFWFLVKSQPLAIHGSRNVFKYISWIRDLPSDIQLAIKPTIKNNHYYFHPENILLSMITDPDAAVRADGYEKIMDARSKATGQTRRFHGFKHEPYINYSSTTYTKMIDWGKFEITEPPCLQFYTQDQLNELQFSGDIIKIPGDINLMN